MWVCASKTPTGHGKKVPGGWFGLALITLSITAVVILLAIVFNYLDSGTRFYFLGIDRHGYRCGAVFPDPQVCQTGCSGC